MDEQLLDEAIAWQRELAGDDADWDGFTAWLEADPKHRRAFDEISLIDRMVDDRAADLHSILPADREEAAPAAGRRRLIVGSVAAALAVAVGLSLAQPRHQDSIYATAAGETRRIALGDGTAVELAPSSKLTIAAADRTALSLAHGEAFFTVRHDPSRNLSITAGDFAISDIGTKFAVSLSGDALRVGVAEGHVSVAGGHVDTSLSAGEQLIARSGATARKSSVAAGDVGSWRRGRLVYTDAPLGLVVADIARFSGQRIILSPELQGRRFSGVLAIGDGSKLLAKLAELMALSWRVEGNHLRLDDRPPR